MSVSTPRLPVITWFVWLRDAGVGSDNLDDDLAAGDGR